ncbi:MAG: methylated-DNA--[protein]-cysteine S-methyltransferase [Labilithrix sp.]|nr:methylated-DNA--[protein]-cysteine S-methyltransferase [Labilithrix sp.]
MSLDRMATPIGTAIVVTDERSRVRAFDFDDFERRLRDRLRVGRGSRLEIVERRAPAVVRRAIADYFDGDLRRLDDLEPEAAGTPFQRSVWRALRAIAPGRTTTYGALAAKIGVPGGARAVGLANGSNPIGLVVPCHRVIGKGGALTGYAGGVHRKRWLLRHEGIDC